MKPMLPVAGLWPCAFLFPLHSLKTKSHFLYAIFAALLRLSVAPAKAQVTFSTATLAAGMDFSGALSVFDSWLVSHQPIHLSLVRDTRVLDQ
jgi:hypothetical protein